MQTRISKHLIAAASFTLVVVASVWLVNAAYVKGVLGRQQTLRKESDFQNYVAAQKERHIDRLFLGASHTEDGADPEYIPGSYNMSDSGESYVEVYYKFRKILDIDRVSVGSVALEFDMNTLSTTHPNHSDLISKLYYRTAFIPYADVEEVTGKNALQIWFEANLPVLGHGRELSYLWNPPQMTPLVYGWSEAAGDLSAMDAAASAREQVAAQFEGQSLIDPVLLEYFKKTLELAASRSIDVYLIMYPTSAQYTDALARDGIGRDGYYSELERVAREALGSRLHIIDLHDAFYGHPEYFSNADHLNAAGATALSKKLAPLVK